uniref:Voltage-gated hydrogen channel 1 n=1 Tax=Schistosoma mansoni TaxID=6183 RepID=A0A5K4FDJ5_SCHMA
MKHKRRQISTEESNQCQSDITNGLLSPMNEIIEIPSETPIATTTTTTTPTKPISTIHSYTKRYKLFFSKILDCKLFHMIIVVLCALDGILVICMLLLEIESLKLKPCPLRNRLNLISFIFECMSYMIISLFLIEIPIKLWTYGIKFYRYQWIELLDVFVCIISFTVDTYNIHRHVIEFKTSHDDFKLAEEYSMDDVEQSIHTTIADAAGLLVLFRLWRVIRIVNSIIVSVTADFNKSFFISIV